MMRFYKHNNTVAQTEKMFTLNDREKRRKKQTIIGITIYFYPLNEHSHECMID